MKKHHFLSAVLFCLITFSCNEDTRTNLDSVNAETQMRDGSPEINETTIGIYHNEMVNFVLQDLDRMSSGEIFNKISTSAYTAGRMKTYCQENNITLPSDTELNEMLVRNQNTSLETVLTSNTFSLEQKNILNECFNALQMIDNDLSRNDALLALLNRNLNKVKTHSASNGKTIAIAIINQLIASDQLWIVQGKINFLSNHNVTISGRPSNGAILAADGKGLALALLYGGFTSPIGWCGSMFVGAGASIGAYMGGPIWWPF